MSIPNASVSASIATLPSARAAIPTLAAILAGRLVAAEKSSFVVAPRQDHAVLAARQEFDAARRSDDVVVGSVAADLQRFGSEEFVLPSANDTVGREASGRQSPPDVAKEYTINLAISPYVSHKLRDLDCEVVSFEK